MIKLSWGWLWWKVISVVLLFHWQGAVLAVLLLSLVGPTSRTESLSLPLRLLLGHHVPCGVVSASPPLASLLCEYSVHSWFVRSCACSLFAPVPPLSSAIPASLHNRAPGNGHFIAPAAKCHFLSLKNWLLISCVSLLGGSKVVPSDLDLQLAAAWATSCVVVDRLWSATVSCGSVLIIHALLQWCWDIIYLAIDSKSFITIFHLHSVCSSCFIDLPGWLRFVLCSAKGT